MRPVAYIGAIAAAIAIGIAGSFGNGAAASLQPSSGAFGSQDIASGPTAPQAFTLRNTGTGTLTYSISITGANAADFAFTNPCGTALGAGSSCPLTVTFDPSSATSETASLSITDNAPGSPHTSALSGTGTSSGGGGGSVTKTAANLWIDGNGGTCTRQSVAGAWVDAQGCSTMQAALTAASAGDTVVFKCGSYGAQSLASGSKASAVSFYAETYDQATDAEATFTATTCATLASLSITTDKIHVFGLQAVNGDTNAPNMVWELHIQDDAADFTDVLVDGWHGHGFGAYASGVTIRYGNFGKVPNVCGAGYDPANDNNDATRFWNNGAPSNNDSLIDSVVHDWLGPPDGMCGLPNQHTDCWQTPGGTNMVITGNLFYNCPTSDMQTGEFSGGLMGTFTISNNFFGPTECCNALSIGQGHCAGVLIENNVIYPVSGQPDNNNGCIGSMTINNNVFTGPQISSCTASTAFVGDHNIFIPSGGTTCGTNSKRCTPNWIHGVPGGFPEVGVWTPELSPSDTCAKDYSNATFPPVDFLNIARPLGVTADAGASEGG